MQELTEQQLIDGNERTIFQNIKRDLNTLGFYANHIELIINPEGDVEYSVDLDIDGGYPVINTTISGKGTLYDYIIDPVLDDASLFDRVLVVVKTYILERLWDIVGENRLLVEEGKIGAKFEYYAINDSLKGWLI